MSESCLIGSFFSKWCMIGNRAFTCLSLFVESLQRSLESLSVVFFSSSNGINKEKEEEECALVMGITEVVYVYGENIKMYKFDRKVYFSLAIFFLSQIFFRG